MKSDRERARERAEKALENPRIEPLDPQHPAATPKDTTVVSFFRTSRKRSQK